jgi:cytochrome c oxidase assembly protein subunit 19
MSFTSMGSSKQVVRPPQRGIFPLDHFRECQEPMEVYVKCMKENRDAHYKCRDLSRQYLQCRMDRGLMSKENLDDMGYSEDQKVVEAREYDGRKEREGFVAGKHIQKQSKWWFQKGKRDWEA